MPKKSNIAIFIDAGNLWSSYKEMGKVLDLNKLEGFFAKKFDGKVFRVFYYVAYPAKGTRPKEKIDRDHKFLTFLKKGLKFSVVKKPLKTIFLRSPKGELIYDQHSGKPQSIEKGNFDVELAIDAMRYSSAYNIAVFMTGDSDFLSLITYLRTLSKSKKVYVFSTKGSVSEELRTGTDGYYDLAECVELHGGPLVNK